MVPYTTYAVFHSMNTVSRFVLPKVKFEGVRSHIKSILGVLDRNQTWILEKMPFYEVGAGVYLLIITLMCHSFLYCHEKGVLKDRLK